MYVKLTRSVRAVTSSWSRPTVIRSTARPGNATWRRGGEDQLTAADVDGVIDGLLRLTIDRLGHAEPAGQRRQNHLRGGVELGDVWVLDRLWRQLGLEAVGLASLRGRSRRPAVERCIRVLVLNRLSDPELKLGGCGGCPRCACLVWTGPRSPTPGCCGPWTRCGRARRCWTAAGGGVVAAVCRRLGPAVLRPDHGTDRRGRYGGGRPAAVRPLQGRARGRLAGGGGVVEAATACR